MKKRSHSSRVLIPVLIFVCLLAALSTRQLTPAPRASVEVASAVTPLATTFTVNSLADTGDATPDGVCDDGAGNCTLREAIEEANALAGTDTINITATGTIFLESSLPDLSTDIIINGPGANQLAVSRSSEDLFRIFLVDTGATVTISGLTISNGTVFGLDGGGILNRGALTITSSALSGNSAAQDSGGASPVGGNGGGIANTGTLTISGSTLSGNTAGADGGGIYNDGTLTIINSTLSGNSANFGGGIFNDGNLTVVNSTLANNLASASGGGIRNQDTLNIKNSIVANSPLGGDCSNTGTINATGVNFSTAGGCTGFTNVTTEQLNLGPLQLNQPGTTRTHALLPGSVAIDAVTDCTDLSAQPAPVTTDQRGVARPQDGDGNQSALCDAGAYEKTFCPDITCPKDITEPGIPNFCGAFVTYATPESECSIICSPPSGAFFPTGTTTVTCMEGEPPPDPDVVQGGGGGATCSFTVTVTPSDDQPPSLSCPENITQATDPNQCSAIVDFAAIASDNCPCASGETCPAVCNPPSGSMFPVGTTDVTCTATDAVGNTAMCSFTVTVNDMQPPSIACPASGITAVTAATCSPATGTVVNYSVPISDNCGKVAKSSCTPPSGSTFPVGTTTVTCTATDDSGNTAMCSFTVSVFSGCLQDDANPGNVVVFNAVTGEYSYCCNGVVSMTGIGSVTRIGCVITIQHNTPDRRVLIKVDYGVKKGNASLQMPPGSVKCTITDKNTSNNNCANCGVPAAPQ